MTKTLYLMRHAEAGPKEGRKDDRSRELTPAGIRAARQAGDWLHQQKITLDLLVSSDALRAEQTIRLVAEGLALDSPRILLDDTLYEASLRQLLDYINQLDDSYNHVLIVGHNPAITYFAEYLTKAEIRDMSPGSIIVIRFELASWKEVSQNTGAIVRRFPEGE